MSPRALKIGGVPEHVNLPWHLAHEKGLFGAAGLDVEWIDQPGGTGAQCKALADGSLDVATVLTDGAIADISRGGPHRMLGWWTTTPMIWGVHVAGAGPITSIGAVEGRPIAVSRLGSGSHLMAHVQAARLGWEVGEFLVVGGMAGAREALASRRADQFLWDRFMTQPLVDSGEFRRVDEEPTPWPAFVVVAAEHALERRSEEVLAAWAVARDEASRLTEAGAVGDLVVERHGLTPSSAAEWWAMTEWAVGAGLEAGSGSAGAGSSARVDDASDAAGSGPDGFNDGRHRAEAGFDRLEAVQHRLLEVGLVDRVISRDELVWSPHGLAE